MTQRRRLDAFLLGEARERGVEVREGTTIDATTAPADWVIGADGANGTTARAFGLGEGVANGVAYEGNVQYGVVERARYARRAIVEFADIPGGYGWVFAKGDHVNVGVGAWQSEGPKIREHLARVCIAHDLDPAQLESLRGHRLPFRRPGVRIAGERTLLVGDAAGLIDPVSGDGMYECFVSARLAVDAVLSGSAAGYQPAVEAELGSLHRASWTMKQALDRWPRTSWRIARTQLLWRTVEHLLLGELKAPAEQHGLARLPLRALNVLGRT
jgi:flavin-dependent dehydrogenase